jgi:ubiquinone/menaquinone biosynthesis C-methylase UbiE
MLDICKTKATNYDPSLITLVTADGENAPFENDSFNAYTICYGLRCCPNREKVLKEAYRILQPGGKFLCLETSNTNCKLAQGLVPYQHKSNKKKFSLEGFTICTALMFYQ